MEREEYLKDISEIRRIMEQSSRFISLSGLSGITAGVIALIGAYFAKGILNSDVQLLSYELIPNLQLNTRNSLLLLGVIMLVAVLSIGVFLSWRRSKKLQQPFWHAGSKKLLSALLIPLVSGGALCLILLQKGLIGILAPITLIFYGLALVSASHFTFSELRTLGILEILLGLIGAVFVGYSLELWAVGFGVLHILYGFIMYFRYER